MKRLFAIAAVLLMPFCAAAQDQPNVLLIISDGHNIEYLNEELTPNLMRLARGGATFTRAFANAPMSFGSRFTILTGRTANAIGATRHFSLLPEGEVTLADELLYPENSRYETIYLGRMIFEEADRRRSTDQPLNGYRRWQSFEDILDIYRRDPTNNRPRAIPKEIRVQSPWKPYNDPARVWLNSENLPVGAPQTSMPASLFTDLATEYIATRTARLSRPFFMTLNYTQPHAPFEYPIEFRNRYHAADVQLPELSPSQTDDVPLVFQSLTDDEKRGVIAAYKTATAYLDHCIGEILDALRESGLERDTIVIYTSTSGYNLGHHGWFEAHSLYEPAVRVPLIIRWPARIRAGTRIDVLVESIDIYPTVLRACGGSPTPRVQGIDLLPLLEGRANRVRDFVFSEFLENEEAMVRDERFKLIYTAGNRRREDGLESPRSLQGGRRVRLFDLQRDPGELRDLSSEAGYSDELERLKQQMYSRFLQGMPGGTGLGAGATIDEHLELLLIPRERWEQIAGYLRGN